MSFLNFDAWNLDIWREAVAGDGVPRNYVIRNERTVGTACFERCCAKWEGSPRASGSGEEGNAVTDNWHYFPYHRGNIFYVEIVKVIRQFNVL